MSTGYEYSSLKAHRCGYSWCKTSDLLGFSELWFVLSPHVYTFIKTSIAQPFTLSLMRQINRFSIDTTIDWTSSALLISVSVHHWNGRKWPSRSAWKDGLGYGSYETELIWNQSVLNFKYWKIGIWQNNANAVLCMENFIAKSKGTNVHEIMRLWAGDWHYSSSRLFSRYRTTYFPMALAVSTNTEKIILRLRINQSKRHHDRST